MGEDLMEEQLDDLEMQVVDLQIENAELKAKLINLYNFLDLDYDEERY